MAKKEPYTSEHLIRMRAHLKECVGILKDTDIARQAHWGDTFSAERSVADVALKAHLEQVLKDVDKLEKELQEIGEHLPL